MGSELLNLRMAVDAAPGDWTLRGAYADMLEELGDVRAEGYRVMWEMGLWAEETITFAWQGQPARSWLTWHHASYGHPDQNRLPTAWYSRIVGGNQLPNWHPEYHAYWPTREDAEDAAALGWLAMNDTERNGIILAGAVRLAG